MKEYKAHIFREGLLSSLFFGQSKINADQLTNELNLLAREGWRVVSMERERRRMLLFFSREAFLIILERDARPSQPKA
jgi:hypothetical protein